MSKRKDHGAKTYLKCSNKVWYVIFTYTDCKAVVVQYILVRKKNPILQFRARN
jgi:hypothetical protein